MRVNKRVIAVIIKGYISVLDRQGKDYKYENQIINE